MLVNLKLRISEVLLVCRGFLDVVLILYYIVLNLIVIIVLRVCLHFWEIMKTFVRFLISESLKNKGIIRVFQLQIYTRALSEDEIKVTAAVV